MTDFDDMTMFQLFIMDIDVIKFVCPLVLIHGVATAPNPYCFFEPACGFVRTHQSHSLPSITRNTVTQQTRVSRACHRNQNIFELVPKFIGSVLKSHVFDE